MEGRKKCIFITGIAGFIGFHLASSLVKSGEYVIGCDNFNNYYSPNLKRKRAHQLQRLGVEVIEERIQNLFSLNQKVTHVVHLAAQAGVRYCLKDPQSYIDENLDGFLKVLELCRKAPKVKLIFASSSSVYGKNTTIPFSETDRTDSPMSLYAATKKGGELMAKSYHHLYHIPMVGLRFFTVYGPWGRPDMAYYLFAEKIQKNEPISVFNYGKMERDFTYIDDIVQGIIQALDLCKGYEIYNLGNNKPEPLMHLVHLLETHLGKKAQIDFQPMQMGDVTTTYANIDKAKKRLGFAPTTSLETGVEKFSKWFLSNQ